MPDPIAKQLGDDVDENGNFIIKDDKIEEEKNQCLLAELGVEEKFNLSQTVESEEGKISFTDPIIVGELKSSGNQLCMRVAELIDGSSPEAKKFTGLFLGEKADDTVKPLGYLTFAFDDDKTATANTYSFARKVMGELKHRLPEDLQAMMSKPDLLSAFEVDQNYRGEGLGAILYLLGVAYLQKVDVDELKILTGAASMTSLDKGTFYGHYGAEMKPDPRYGAVESMLTQKINDYREKLQAIFK